MPIKLTLSATILLTGVLASLSTLSITNFLEYRKKKKRRSLISGGEDRKSEIIDSEVLVKEQLSRNEQFLGPEGLSKLRGSYVIIVGLGGVGVKSISAKVSPYP